MHLTESDLRTFLDIEVASPERNARAQHLKTCAQCRQHLSSMRALDRVIRKSMHEKAPVVLTANILRELRIEEAPGMAWKMLQYMAPVFALLLIGGIVFTVFRLTGTIHQTDIQSSFSIGRNAAGRFGSAVTAGSTSLNTWAKSYLHFAFAGKALTLTIFLLCFFGAVAIMDKFLFVPMLRRGLERRTLV